MNNETTKLSNTRMIEWLSSNDASLQKQAADAANSYVRVKAREDGILRNILQPVPVTQSDLDRQYGIEQPVMIFEKEPDTGHAVTVPFGGDVESRELSGDEFMVVFDTIRTHKKYKSKFELMNYRYDLRSILTDLDTKEILEREDLRFFSTVDKWLGAAGATHTDAGGVALHQNVYGGLTAETMVDMLQIMPRASARFETATIVMNNILSKELLSWDADEVGPDFKQEVVVNGWGETKLFGRRLLVTNKRDIVGDDEVYMFAEPDTLGKFCVLQDVTIYPKAEEEMIQWHALECIGLSIAQRTGMAKATIAQ
jgi:hypothetical protein